MPDLVGSCPLRCTRETLSNLQNTVIFPWFFDQRRSGSVCFHAVPASTCQKSLCLPVFFAVYSPRLLCIADSSVLFTAALALSAARLTPFLTRTHETCHVHGRPPAAHRRRRRRSGRRSRRRQAHAASGD